MNESVGVVVVVRDGEAYLRDAMTSVLSQTRPDDAVVVVVGASSDNSLAVAQGHVGGSTPVEVVAQLGLGLAAARNQAIGLLEAELIAFCDADDRWADGSLDRRRSVMNAQPRADAVIGQLVTTELDTDVPVRRRVGLGIASPGYTPGALLARRSVFDVVGDFDTSLAIGCDSDWFVRLHDSPLALAQIDDVVLNKGVRNASLSTDVGRYREDLLAIARAHVHRRSVQP